jgi:hypothetical protein
VFIGQLEGSVNLVVVEGADGCRSQSQSHRLQMNVLGGMPDFDADIALGALPVTPFHASVVSSDDDIDRGPPNEVLPGNRLAKLWKDVTAQCFHQFMVLGHVVIDAFLRHQVDLKWVESTG